MTSSPFMPILQRCYQLRQSLSERSPTWLQEHRPRLLMTCAREVLGSYTRPSITVYHILKEKDKQLYIYHYNASSKINKLKDLVKELMEASSLVEVEAIALEGRGLVIDYESNQRNWKTAIDDIEPEFVVELLRSAGTGKTRAEDWVGRMGACIKSDYAYYEHNFAVKVVKDWFEKNLSFCEKMIRKQATKNGGVPKMNRPKMKRPWAAAREYRERGGEDVGDRRET